MDLMDRKWFLAGHWPDNSEMLCMSFFVVDEDRCLNYNYKRTECHNCRKICPRQCWDESGQPWPERCDGCGLCQAVCPVDAIAVAGIPAAEWTALLKSPADILHLSCRRHGTGPWSCLGFLNARDLVTLALEQQDRPPRNLIVYLSPCRQCNPAVAAHLETELEAAAAFLASYGKLCIHKGKQPPQLDEAMRVLSRRSFFGSLLETGLATVRNVMWPEEIPGPLTKAQDRARILAGWSENELALPQAVFPLISVGAGCLACELCAKVCPTGSLTALDHGQSLELRQEPLLCTGCGLCVAHCPAACVSLEENGPALATTVCLQEYPCCNECGKPFKPAGQQLTCFDCLLKGRESIFGP